MQLTFWVILSALIVVATLFVVVPQVARQRTLRLSMPALAAAAFVPVLSITMYLLLGAPDAMTAPRLLASEHRTSPAAARVPPSRKGSAPVSELVDGLAERLAREPGDAGGWLLLARSYHFLGRQEEARRAYARAAALGSTDAGIAASLQMDGEASNSAEGQAAISGRVTLSAPAAALLRPGDSVFVFAKAEGGAGMPVAALRRLAKDLPFDFTLTDAAAVMPGARLSDLEEASVSARVSRSGRATDSIEGLEAAGQVVSTHSGDVIQLVIGPAVPDGAMESAE